jgi:Domain of unknown function (DU1801)
MPTRFADPAVEAHFAAYPPAARKALLALRALVSDTARRTQGVGELAEVLKWNEPAYGTVKGAGSTVRIDWKAKHPDQYAMYFHCQSGLVDEFRQMFPHDFRFEGERAIVFRLGEHVPTDALGICIAMALTHHSRKRARGRSPST